MMIGSLVLLCIVGCVVGGGPGQITLARPISKRGIPWISDGFGDFGGSSGGGWQFGGGSSFAPWSFPKPWAPSPTEVANAIQAAKQASANVLIAQQQVSAAKENVLQQQRAAMEKESAATLLTQKSEAQAAIQRSEAAAAAQSVVLAQQRLAQAKAAVAHQQRLASSKESEAANALQKAAHAAAAEIQRTEFEASKYANLQRGNVAAASHHLTATKDAALSSLTAGTNHVPGLEALGNGWHVGGPPSITPWSNQGITQYRIPYPLNHI
ncbi:hypothetical protein ACFFRR_004006 [Megaselia abdita]